MGVRQQTLVAQERSVGVIIVILCLVIVIPLVLVSRTPPRHSIEWLVKYDNEDGFWDEEEL